MLRLECNTSAINIKSIDIIFGIEMNRFNSGVSFQNTCLCLNWLACAIWELLAGILLIAVDKI